MAGHDMIRPGQRVVAAINKSSSSGAHVSGSSGNSCETVTFSERDSMTAASSTYISDTGGSTQSTSPSNGNISKHNGSSSTGLRSAVAGLLAGAANVFCGYPFDTVKVRMQEAGKGVYSNALTAAKTIVRKEGATALFRGVPVPTIGGALETGVCYFVYRSCLERFGSLSADTDSEARNTISDSGHSSRPSSSTSLTQERQRDEQHSLLSVACAAGVSGIFLSVVISPFELVKCRLQSAKGIAAVVDKPSISQSPSNGIEGDNRKKRKSKDVQKSKSLNQFERLYGTGEKHMQLRGNHVTPLNTVRGVIADEGVRGLLTRGLGGTLLREIPGSAIFFASYELLRRQMRSSMQVQDGSAADLGSAVLCGGLAGMTYWFFIYPVDMAKTRAQLAKAGTAGDVSILTHMRREYYKCGVRGMYNGIGATLARAFPSNAAQWLVWELSYNHVLPLLGIK